MAEFTLRQAAAEDFPAIRRLIQRVQINPTGLDWHRFVVAVDGSGKMLGCGQLKPHDGGIVELASIAVEPSHRKRGVARAIIEYLISQAPRPLYLTCRSGLGSFYEKWGFRTLEMNAMPPYFRRLAQLASLMPELAARGERLLVMELK